jgi:prepilin-type processing-associated H-X9-DG protein
MAKHLTTDEQRAFLLKTLPESRLLAARAHLEGCTECRAALQAERKRLANLDALKIEEGSAGLAERTLERIANRHQSRETSFAGLVFAASLIFVLSATFYFSFGRAREAARRASTQNNMKQFGLIFKMYANESPDSRWPLLASAEHVWVPDLAALQKKFLSDPEIMVSERHPDKRRLKQALEKAWDGASPDLDEAASIMGESFAYLGYTMDNEAEFEAILQAKEANALPVEDVSLPSPTTGIDVHALREGVERFLITDINNPAGSSTAQSTIPVLVEIATWKYKDSVEDFNGTNVLFMDGHVEFVKLGTFPVLPSILDALTGVE